MLKDSILIFVNKIITILFTLFFGIIISRVLGPSQRGQLTLIFLPLTILSLLFRGGIEISNIHFLKDKKFKRQDITTNSFILGSILSIFSIFLFYLLFDYLPEQLFGKINPEYITFPLLLVLPEILFLYSSMSLIGIGKIKAYSLLNILAPALNLASLIALYLCNKEITLEATLSIYIFTYLLRFLTSVYILNKEIGFNSSINFDLIGKLSAYGIKGHLGNIFDFFIMRTDLLLIGYFLDTKALGLYTVAIVGEKILIIPDSIGFSILSHIKVKDNGTGSARACRISIAITSITCFAAALSAQYLIPLLFGIEYRDSTTPFIILIAAYFFLSITKPIKSYIYIKMNHPEFSTYASVISLFLNIVLNIIFIPKYGISGAAITTLISNCVYAIIILTIFLKDSRLPLLKTVLLQKEDIVLILKVFHVKNKANK